MSHLMFPDNTVLVNFAHLNRLDLFERIVHGRGAWCVTVAEECAVSAGVPGLDALREVPAILGDPLTLDSIQEVREAEKIRLEMGRPGESRYRNLGEAETMAVISLRPQLHGVLVTDDQGALLKAKDLSITTYTTADLLTLCAKAQLAEVDEMWNAIIVLRGIPRFLPTCAASYFEFSQHCAPKSRELPAS